MAIVLGVLLVAGGVAAVSVAGDRVVGSPPSGSPRALPPTGAGESLVELSADAATHPAGAAVRVQLQRYFDAINQRDYRSWQDTVVPARSESLPEPAWQQAYRSTRDGTVRVDRIDGSSDGALLVRVRFVSTQDLADAPPDVAAERICWRSTLLMEGSPPRIGMTRGGSSTAEAC